MKKNRKISLMIVAVMLAVICFVSTGCGGDNSAADPNTLIIYAWEGGHGLQWLKDIANDYMEKNENITIKIESSTLRDKINIPLTQKSKYDLLMGDYIQMVSYAVTPQITGYTKTFVDITDVFDYTPEGETKKISEKMIPAVYDFNTLNGKNYYISLHANLYGLTYNTEMLSGYTLPRTTDELYELCQELKEDEITPFIFSGDTDYWRSLLYSWWAQYETKENFEKFFMGQDESGRTTYEIFLAQGRYEALKAAEQFLKPSNGFAHPLSTGYIFMSAQTKYLMGEAAMMVNGGWLLNEMSGSLKSPADIDFMPVPLISAIKDKLDSINDEDDETLRAVVDYVDGVTDTAPAGVDPADIETVRKARNACYIGGYSYLGAIPIYTPKAELAKDFLKFFFTDESAKTMIKTKCGAILPITTDFSGDTALMNSMGKMERSVLSTIRDKDLFFQSFKHPIAYKGGLDSFKRGVTVENAFAATNSKDRISAEDYFAYDYEYYSANNGMAWTNLLKIAGLL